MAIQSERPLDDAKYAYLDAFLRLRAPDIAVFAVDGNIDAVTLLVYYASRQLNMPLTENGLVDYWRALRRFETALEAAGAPA